MDFFDSRNYRLNKILLLAIGQWPYQSSKTSCIIVVVIATIACSQFLTKLCGMFSYIHDLDIVIECLTPIMIDILGITKVVNSILCVNEMRALLDQIREDFRSLKNASDIEILQKCADNGRKFSSIYIYTLYTLMVIFMLTPLPPLIFHDANETTRPLLHIVEYYVDMNKYYVPILIHGYLTVAICVTSVVATDAIFVILVQHVCGMFIVTGFIDLMEAAYSKHFLFYAGFNMLTISVTGVGAVTKLNDPSELLKLIAVTWALLFHLFFECLNAQRLIDYSGYFYTNLINLNWYNTSTRTKKLILFMMMKARPPCVLTAGGMFVLCMESFATILKTAVSYYTFLRSAQ
ncbi:hypothetical protein ACFW04_003670 [Cataglyphis niger]